MLVASDASVKWRAAGLAMLAVTHIFQRSFAARYHASAHPTELALPHCSGGGVGRLPAATVPFPRKSLLVKATQLSEGCRT